jgi:C4-dicarboxylate transporter, DctQ subunit
MLKRFSFKDIVLNFDTIAAGIALVLLVFITFFGVIMRYVMSSPFAWEEEVQLALIIWVVFFGGRYAFIAGNHPAIDMIVNLFPVRSRKITAVLITVASIVLLLYTGFQGWKYVLQMYLNHRVTNMIHIPYALIYIALPLGCLLMSGQLTFQTWKKLTDRTENKEREDR